MAEAELSLADQFPRVTNEQWLDMVDGVLKGGSFDRLRSRTYDGIGIEPLYPAAPACDELLGRSSQTWDIRVEHRGPDAAALNALILEDLEGGATSVVLHTPDHLDSAWLSAALDGVLLELAGLVLVPAGDVVDAAALLRSLWTDRAVDPATVSGSFGADPIGRLSRHGGDLASTAMALTAAAGLVGHAAPTDAAPSVTTFNLDTAPYVDAGASEALEIGIALATGVVALRDLLRAGLTIDAAASQIEFTLAADADLFATIAKLRSFRRCWAHVLTAAGSSATTFRVTARQADRILSRRDPWVNMLRGTSACAGAALGGADAVVVSAFDAPVGEPEHLGRRVARNTQLLLMEESHLGRVVDPAAGSGYIEALTDELSVAAWTCFQEIEGDGGILAAIGEGVIAARLADVAARRGANIAKRRDPLTGVSEFPDLSEQALVRTPALTDGATGHSDDPIAPLPVVALDHEFEALRAASDGHVARHGVRPRVFLANLGSVATHTARASWAKNFFEAGGIEALGNDGFADAASVAAGFTASGATIAVLCSDDGTYADWGAAAADALRTAGAVRVYVAGKVDVDGVDEAVHVGVDVAAALRGVQSTLGVLPNTDREAQR